MKEFNLKDTSFSHIEFTAPGVTSKHINWRRENEYSADLPTFYTHEQLIDPEDITPHGKYGLMLESQAIIPGVYGEIGKWMDKFNTVFTHSTFLLTNFKNTKWIPGGSLWVGGTYGGGEVKIYPKSKLCSMVSSDKNMCHLHRFRIAISEFIERECPEIDLYGSLQGKWVPIIDTLADYMFSICIENYVDKSYFTEKILNCFATGTVPVYIGATDIGNYFNTDGIIQFSTPGQLIDAIGQCLSTEYYDSKKKAIEENFHLCQKYRLIEDYIAEHYI